MEARRDPVIIHYIFGKPWEEGCDHPYRSTFIKYQAETKWKGCIWKTPKRPFWVKVRSHLKNILVEMGLLKASADAQKATLFLDLPPID